MGDTSIKDVRCSNPLRQGTDATFGFRRHPSVNNTIVNQLPCLREPELSNEGVGIVAIAKDSLGIGQQN